MYSRSHISLGFGGVDGHGKTYTLKRRDFEVPMSGGLYLTQQNPELERCYDIGREIVTYNDYNDLFAKIKYFLANPDEAEAIRKRGYQRALSEHSWQARFEKVLRLFGLLKY